MVIKKNNFIKIDNKKIGKDYSPVLIAELGINHSGDINLAIDFARKAIENGADIIKNQTHIVSDEMSKEAKNVIPQNSNKSIYQIMKDCSLSAEDEYKLKKYVESKGSIFISTPFSRAAADRLNKMDVKAFKIGSGECNNYPLIEHIAKFKKPMIVSTGMNNIESVKKTGRILDKFNIKYALLHCTNIYPTPPKLVRLGGILELEKNFKNAVIGYSDHTTSNLACIAALSIGASIIERHFIDNKRRKGPDIINSMNPKELNELYVMSKEIFKMRGGKKEAAKEEGGTIKFAFATLVAIKNIKKGEKFNKNNIWVKRPGTGEILAEHYNDIIGRISTCDIEYDDHIKVKDIKNFKLKS